MTLGIYLSIYLGIHVTIHLGIYDHSKLDFSFSSTAHPLQIVSPILCIIYVYLVLLCNEQTPPREKISPVIEMPKYSLEVNDIYV